MLCNNIPSPHAGSALDILSLFLKSESVEMYCNIFSTRYLDNVSGAYTHHIFE